MENNLVFWILLGGGGLMVLLIIGVLLARGGKKSKSVGKKNKNKNKNKNQETQEQDRARAIYQLISSLSATLNYQRVLETALDTSITVLSEPGQPNDKLVCAVLVFAARESDPSKTHLVVGSARRFSAPDMRTTLPGTSGVIGKTIDTGEAQLSKNLSQDNEIQRIIALHPCKTVYCIPLRAGLDTFGVILFAHPDPEYFTEARREILDVIGHQAVIAMQNAQLYRNLEQEKERMAEIQEEARKKLARDLHDGPTQSVAAIAMRVNFARRLMTRDPKAAAEELEKIEELARRTTKEIRHMLFTLRPLVLESKGLIAALEAMAEKMKETYNQNVIIQAEAHTVGNIEMGKQGVMFYIAEEAVNNARKHAQAAHIWVRIKSIQPDLVLLEIQDDGVGFNLGAVDANYENRGSLGMVNMRERAELINGVLHIESAEGRGTRIRVAIPLSEEALDRLRNRRV